MYYLICLFIGVIIGYFLCALMVISKDSDERMNKIIATEALKILKKYNPLRHDTDAYLFEIVDWGLGKREKPSPVDFGIQEGNEN